MPQPPPFSVKLVANEGRAVQVTPSGLVTQTSGPCCETATKIEPFQQMASTLLDPCAVVNPAWAVQVTPSGLVAHLPDPPTATNLAPFQQTEFAWPENTVVNPA
jgi:hypothetical protein